MFSHMLFIRDMPKMKRPRKTKDKTVEENTSGLICHIYQH